MKRRWGVLLAALPLVALVLLAWSLRSDSPEPADWRVYAREPELSFAGGWFDFAGRPNHLGFAILYRALLSLGVDIATLVAVGWAVAALCVGVVCRLAPRAILAWPLLALLVFSPAFSANWLLLERLRVFVPAACACAMVLLLSAPLHRARFVVAMGLAMLAVLTHETGSLVWVAMLPLMVSTLRRAGRGVFTYVATFVIANNVALTLCYDESARDYPGLVSTFFDQPAATTLFMAKLVSLTLPDVLADTHLDAVVIGIGLLAMLIVGAALLYRRADQELAAVALPWLSLALAGLAQAVAIAHVQLPQAIADAVLRELAWGTWLLPVGAVGLWCHLAPQTARRLAPALTAAALVVLLQDWHRGVGWMRAEARFLRQSEALLVFADLERERPAVPRPSVPLRTDRDALRGAGLLRRTSPVADPTLRELSVRSPDGSIGRVVQVTPTSAAGVVVRANTSGDLVLVMRQRGSEPTRLCRVAVPNHLDVGAMLPWQADLGDVDALAEGDEVYALAFDLAARSVAALEGRYRWQNGQFVVVEGSR